MIKVEEELSESDRVLFKPVRKPVGVLRLVVEHGADLQNVRLFLEIFSVGSILFKTDLKYYNWIE